MSQNLSTPAAFLTNDQTLAHLIAAQNVTVTAIPTETETWTGDEKTITTTYHNRYGTTPESEVALTALTTAFRPLMQKVGKAAKFLKEDEVTDVMDEAFMAAVRMYDPATEIPFCATIRTILFRALSDHEKTSTDIIAVPEAVAARYWRLMHKNNLHALDAFNEVRDNSGTHFTTTSFLAVHRALGGLDSLDHGTDADGEETGPSDRMTTNTQYRHLSATTPSPEEAITNEALVSWLWTKVTDRQEMVLRARLGFDDDATEVRLSVYGLSVGTVLTDGQAAMVCDLGTKTANIAKREGIKSMQAAYQTLVDEVEVA